MKHALSSPRSRSLVRRSLALILASQTTIVGAFLLDAIDEPYPAIILPAFDQVLEESNDRYVFVLPRVRLKFADGRSQEIEPDVLFQGSKGLAGIRSYWAISRALPPPESWQPSLPTFGRVRGSSKQSEAFLRYVGANQYNPEVTALSIAWERRTFEAAPRLREIKAANLAEVEVRLKR